MKIQKRIVNAKKHTLGYIIDGKAVTRKQAVNLAKDGLLTNIDVSTCNGSSYIRRADTTRARPLYELPTVYA